MGKRRRGAARPIGESGLVKFNAAGDIVWHYDGQAFDKWIDDCDALNVTGDAWACLYTDFPILRIGETGPMRLWKSEIAGANAIAVDGQHVVLAGGYGDDRARLALLRLKAEGSSLLFEAELDLGTANEAEQLLLTARGDQVHVVTALTWFRLSVAEIVREAEAATA